MAMAGAIQHSVNSRRQKTVQVDFTPSGNYPAGGEPILLSSVTNPKFNQTNGFGSVPTRVTVDNMPAGYIGEIVAGAGSGLDTSYKLKIWTAVNTELAAAAYPAGLLADVFQLSFQGGNWTM